MKDRMKKFVKSFTFWFSIAGIAVVIFNLLNLDDMNIVMIGLNPVLNILSSSDLCSAIADVPYLWHILALVTMAGYGLLIDGIRKLIRK